MTRRPTGPTTGDDAALRAALDPAQWTEAARHKLPRARLSRPVRALLVLLRLYVLAAVPLVGYAFWHALTTTTP